MRALLDTHALLWWAAGDRRMSRRARDVVTRGAAEVLVSAATAWEISTKARLGKLGDVGRLSDRLREYLEDQGFVELPVTIPHAQRAALLPALHRDPFDRMLVAQAQIDGLVLVSTDEVLDGYGVSRVW